MNDNGLYGRNSVNGKNNGNAWETSRNMLEMENDRHIGHLSEQVSMLKELTIDIGNEVNSQNHLLEGMGSGMMDVNGLMKSTINKIGTMMQRGGSKHMCYLVLFIMFTFTVIWWIMSKK
eukprot:CAMPEP_0171473256 /NCGR_PEP_ID=MMETSP0946-20130122/1739_1 /TAXON_ID=109269 /ORGANISM="Vaucheria litorea, Strain CCMP2940" /LENGTH=118 /DNA_ID=CAMNT_0012002997 /DNA_START=70 /DNA_END=426 /DNA_ORIENTATION=+